MHKIDVENTGPHEYGVTVNQDGTTTKHHIRVPQRLLDDLAVTEDNEERLVQESFVFLLEREPATSILREFDLDVISRYFPEYGTEIRSRL
ncbi:MAG: hypothetical protein GEV03_09845 [Streptosporangiales bacterium]|nr:hypothetical protein [Streptosporangiales bacterium]